MPALFWPLAAVFGLGGWAGATGLSYLTDGDEEGGMTALTLAFILLGAVGWVVLSVVIFNVWTRWLK